MLKHIIEFILLAFSMRVIKDYTYGFLALLFDHYSTDLNFLAFNILSMKKSHVFARLVHLILRLPHCFYFFCPQNLM